MPSFFLKKSNNRKRKQNVDKKNKDKKKPKKFDDEEIDSDEADVNEDEDDDEEYSAAGDESGETAEEKRIRLTKTYLEEIEKEVKARSESGSGGGLDLDEAINARLKKDSLEESGKLKRNVADKVTSSVLTHTLRDSSKGHKLPVTCVTVSMLDGKIFSGSKCGGICVWDPQSGQRIARIVGNKKAVNCLALSYDAKFLASGCDERFVTIRNPDDLSKIHTFKGHRDSVTGLAFNRSTHTLYSCSADRSIKVWNLTEMAYVETLFGHQDRVAAIDARLGGSANSSMERALTCGSRDGSVRLWKIVDESQLVFNSPPGSGSLDCVKLINEDHFITGSAEEGSISLWGVMKKRPLATINAAHGVQSGNDSPNWITSVAAFPMSDFIASGSSDGLIRFWKCGNNFRSLEAMPNLNIRVNGFVNGLAFSKDGRTLAAAIGQEHRTGRWWRIKEAKNSVVVINLEGDDFDE